MAVGPAEGELSGVGLDMIMSATWSDGFGSFDVYDVEIEDSWDSKERLARVIYPFHPGIATPTAKGVRTTGSLIEATFLSRSRYDHLPAKSCNHLPIHTACDKVELVRGCDLQAHVSRIAPHFEWLGDSNQSRE